MRIERPTLGSRGFLSAVALVAAAVLTLHAGPGCTPDADPALPSVQEPAPIRLIALGDSYTAGEGCDPEGSWTAQMSVAFTATRDSLVVATIAQTGWTAADLLAGLNELDPDPLYDLATIQIGANDLFRDRPLADYLNDLEDLLDDASRLAGDDASRLLVLSIPDCGVTPVGLRFGGPSLSARVDAFNAGARSLAAVKGATWVDVTETSRAAADDPTLLARDQLHYSAAMYARWVEILAPILASAVNR